MLSIDKYVNMKYHKEQTRRRNKGVITHCAEYFKSNSIYIPSEADFEKLKDFLISEGRQKDDVTAHVNRTKEYYDYCKEDKQIVIDELENAIKGKETEEAEDVEPVEVEEPEQGKAKSRGRKSTKSGTIEAMNFKINSELKRKFLLLAEMGKTTATDIITKYIEKCISENTEELERYISVKDTFIIKL